MDSFIDAERCVNQIIETIGKDIVIGLPLGLGKPNQLINALYKRAVANPDIKLKIITALSLEKPRPSSDLEARFLVPFVERVFGNYEELEYAKAVRTNKLPKNVVVSEFYFKAGAMKKVPSAQRNYVSSNYTFVCRDLITNGVNVVAQLVGRKVIDGETKLSLSCNTDTTLDLVPVIEKLRAEGKKILTIGQVHDDLPFMYNQAMVDPDYFDMVVHHPSYNTTLFAPPNMSVPNPDYMAGLYASTLIKDGGTLQIGIGSLGDAIVYACKLRHEHNDIYREVVSQLNSNPELIKTTGGLDSFKKGLYGSSEMFVNGFMHLIKSGIVKRKVYDDLDLQRLLNAGKIQEQVTPDTLITLLNEAVIGHHLSHSDVIYLQRWGIFSDQVKWQDQGLVVNGEVLSTDLTVPANLERVCQTCLGTELKGGIHMHGGFFLGPRDFYQALRDMPRVESEKIGMSSVGHINQLDYNHSLLSLQRKDARFINTGMMATLSGAIVSDGLEDGTVVSGVGGQYNFVAQAHALADGRSILCIRSTRGSGKNLASNIVHFYGHTTIPRHLRDIVVTEYGIADLQGRSDEEVAIELLKVADSRFQETLLAKMKAVGKIREDYQLPEKYKHNLPQNLAAILKKMRTKGYFPAFPLGTDFTDEEITLGKTLKEIKAKMAQPKEMVKAVIRSLTLKVDEKQAKPFLERLNLERPGSTKEKIIQNLILLELEENGYLKPM